MNSLDPSSLTAVIKDHARTLQFDLVGVAPATVGLQSDRLRQWLADGKHGEMDYMQRHEDARRDPNNVLDGVRSLVMVGLVYRTVEPMSPRNTSGRISRYAWGGDYHDEIRRRLRQLADRLREEHPIVHCRAVVDSAPVMERDYAVLAGLGWIGKNTLLLNKRLGSWFFLGALLVDASLQYDVPFETDHCGSCTRCLDACPTDAFEGPYQLDPRRCISYLTIEHKSPLPKRYLPQMGDWLFGCDVCQDVCPWNTKPDAAGPSCFEPLEDNNPVDLCELLGLDDAEFEARFRATPLERTGRLRVLRNACIVAANQNAVETMGRLEKLARHEDPGLRNAARWALKQLTRRESI